MNKLFIIALAVITGVILVVLVFGAGLMVVQANWGTTGTSPFNMMGWTSRSNNPIYSMWCGNGYNMMGRYANGNTVNTKPLTIDQTKQAVESYLKDLDNADLELKEIMIFDNHAYARITEKSTGIGAMELLVDPISLSVFPEFGPNMMWNLKYGHMSGNGMMGGRGMMGGYNINPGSVDTNMTVTPEQALQVAQQFLDQRYPGYKTAEDADPFYGYYTIDIMKDGQPTGMLSVNGYSGQVFLHTWHGTFIEMFEFE